MSHLQSPHVLCVVRLRCARAARGIDARGPSHRTERTHTQHAPRTPPRTPAALSRCLWPRPPGSRLRSNGLDHSPSAPVRRRRLARKESHHQKGRAMAVLHKRDEGYALNPHLHPWPPVPKALTTGGKDSLAAEVEDRLDGERRRREAKLIRAGYSDPHWCVLVLNAGRVQSLLCGHWWSHRPTAPRWRLHLGAVRGAANCSSTRLCASPPRAQLTCCMHRMHAAQEAHHAQALRGGLRGDAGACGAARAGARGRAAHARSRRPGPLRAQPVAAGPRRRQRSQPRRASPKALPKMFATEAPPTRPGLCTRASGPNA